MSTILLLERLKYDDSFIDKFLLENLHFLIDQLITDEEMSEILLSKDTDLLVLETIEAMKDESVEEMIVKINEFNDPKDS